MRREDIVDIYISEGVADKLWSKHVVAEEEVHEVFENPDEAVKIRHSDVVPGS